MLSPQLTRAQRELNELAELLEDAGIEADDAYQGRQTLRLSSTAQPDPVARQCAVRMHGALQAILAHLEATSR